MFKLTCVATVAAIAALASAAQAKTVEQQPSIVHISVDGKAPAQVKREIFAAADKVCYGDWDCQTEAAAEALAQYRHLSGSDQKPLSISFLSTFAHSDPTTIRVVVASKPRNVVEAEIRDAANKVCVAANLGASSDDVNECVTVAVANAERQLRGVQLASN